MHSNEFLLVLNVEYAGCFDLMSFISVYYGTLCSYLLCIHFIHFCLLSVPALVSVEWALGP